MAALSLYDPWSRLRGRRWPARATLAVLGVVAYLGAFEVPFHFDDYPAIVDNALAHDPWQPWAIWCFFSQRFLVFWSFAWNTWFAGGLDDVRGFHAVNIAIHVACGLLVYELLLTLERVLERSPDARERRAAETPMTSAGLAAFAGALVFLWHPIQTQAVTYIWQRATSLAALFALAAILCHLRSVEASMRPQADERDATRAKRWLGGAIVAGVLGMLTKESAFAIPFIVFAFEWTLCGRCPQVPSDVLRRSRRARLAAWSATIPVIPVLLWTMGDPAIEHMQTLGRLGPLEYFATQLSVLWTYARLIVLPIGQSLDHDHSYASSLFEIRALLSAMGLALVIAIGIRLRRSSPLASFAVLLFFLGQATESSFLPLADVIFEHRLYLPMLAVAILVSLLVERCVERILAARAPRPESLARSSLAMHAVVVLLLVPLLIATVGRNEVWASPVSLWEDAAAKAPGKARCWENLGQARLDAGDALGASRAYEQALRLEPGRASTLNALGVAYRRSDQRDRAVACFLESIRVAPESSRSSTLNLASSFTELGEHEHALTTLVRAIDNEPEFLEARALLVESRLDAGDVDGATTALDRFVAYRGAPSRAIVEFALRLLDRRERELAGRALESLLVAAERAERRDVDRTQAHATLALIAHLRGDLAELRRQLAAANALGLTLDAAGVERLARRYP